MANKYLGPFRVKQTISSHGQAYCLNLPETYHIHNVFYVSLLELYYPWANLATEAVALLREQE